METCSITTFLVYILPIVLTFVLLVFWRTCTEWDDDTDDVHFPTRLQILSITLLTFIPILGFIICLILIGIYTYFRMCDNLKIKKNKFSKFWMDVDNE